MPCCNLLQGVYNKKHEMNKYSAASADRILKEGSSYEKEKGKNKGVYKRKYFSYEYSFNVNIAWSNIIFCVIIHNPINKFISYVCIKTIT